MAGAYEDESVIGVGGAIEPLWSDVPPRWLPDEFRWVVGCTYRGLPEHPAPVRNVIGANMSFRRAVFDRTGEFTSGVGRLGTLPFGCEETEFSIRARRAWPGGTILYDPGVRVRHRVPASRATLRYFVSRCYAEGRSKALIAALVGNADALATERTYTAHVLPAGVARGLSDALLRLDPGGLRRAAAIVLGLAVTALGFARAKLVQGPALRARM